MGRPHRIRLGYHCRQAARTQLRRELEIGTSVVGRPIIAWHFTPPAYAKPRAPAILLGTLHGDDTLGVHCLAMLARDLVERPPGRDTWIVPIANPDGLAGGSKNNANDVDLDRNFAASNWVAAHGAGYSPGPNPESEPETTALVDLIARTGATRLVSLHSPCNAVKWSGAGCELAEQMAERNGYGAATESNDCDPGSFAAKYGTDAGLELVSLEFPLVEEARAWTDNRAALRWVVDLPT